MNFISKLFLITETNNKKLFFLVFVIICSSLADIFSIGLIYPYTKVILNDYDLIRNITFLKNYTSTLSNNDIFYFLSYFLIIIFFVKFILTLFLRYIIIKYTHGRLPNLQLRLTQKYQFMTLNEKNIKKDSDVIRNLKELSESTISCLENILRMGAEIVILLSISIYLIFVNAEIFLILSSIIFIFGVIFYMIVKPIVYDAGQKRINADSNIISMIQDMLTSFKEVRVLGKQNFFVPKLEVSANTIFRSVLINNISTIVPRYSIELIVIFFVVIYAIINFNISSFNTLILPSLAVFGFAGLRIIPLASSIIRLWVHLKYNLPVIDTVYHDFKFNNSETNQTIKFEKEDFLNLQIENLNFKYQDNKENIFENLNFSISKNECIGIKGKSGSGKTSFINIIAGLLKCNKGNIYLNNKLTNKSLFEKAKVSYIAQDNLVLKDSIKKNITLENNLNSINLKKLEDSINFSNFADVIKKNNLSLDDMIGDNIKLSGGEAKRLSIARALYHECQILILDEALNSLDEDNKKDINNFLKTIKSKITMIIISHNEDDLRICDKVFEINNKKLELVNL